MNNKKKITLIVSIALVSILLIIGVSYAAMSYNKAGSNQQLVLGDIWMKYDEVSGLSISDALPGADYSNYFEFTITGKNTYTKKDIYYDFILTRGDLPEGKSEDYRIPDEYLKFKLVSVDDSNQETVIFQDETYESLENQRIYVETIAKNTTSEVNRKYRLYMTIDYSLEIGNTSTAVFTTDEWEQAFATVKLNVTGDFSEKKVLTYNDCFETNTLEDGTLEITDYYKYNASSTNELYQNPLCTSDVVIPSTMNGVSITRIGNSAFSQSGVSSVDIPNSITSIGNSAFFSNGLKSVEIPNSVTTIGSLAFLANVLSSVTFEENSNLRTIKNGAFDTNKLTSIDIPDSVVVIESAAFNDNELLDSEAFIYARTDKNGDGIAEIDTTTIVSYGGLNKNPIIPTGVTTIGPSAFDSTSLTSIEIPNSVTTIGSSAFNNNSITSIEIPNSVTTIGDYAFYRNKLTSIEIPENVMIIGVDAFAKNSLTEITLSHSEEDDGVSYGYRAFATHGSSDAGNNRITRVIYKSSIGTDWDYIFGVESIDDTNYISEGTYKFYYEGELVEILIQASAPPEPTAESCFTTTSIDSTSVEIIDYDTSCGTDVIIPSKINEKNVTRIASGGLSGSGLTSVVIPNTVTTIEYNAFYNNQLTSVVIPDSVTSIETFAFAYNYLEKVVLGSSVENISSAAFPTYSHSYSGSNMITNVVNKSGNSFDWGSVFGLSYDGNNTFATGTYYLYGDQTIEITDREPENVEGEETEEEGGEE